MSLRIELSENEKKRGFRKPFRQAFIHTPCMTAHMWTSEEAIGHSRRAEVRTQQMCKVCKKAFPLDQFVFQVRGEKGEIYHESMHRWEHSASTSAVA
jgi:hypothetical protein